MITYLAAKKIQIAPSLLAGAEYLSISTYKNQGFSFTVYPFESEKNLAAIYREVRPIEMPDCLGRGS